MTPQFYLKVLGLFQQTMNDLQTIVHDFGIKQRTLIQSEAEKQKNIPQQAESESDSSLQEDISKREKTKKIKKKKKQIPGMPKPPPNSFVMYLQQVKHLIQKQNPGISIAVATSIASKQWKQIPEEQKQYYKNLHEVSRQAYLKKKEEFIREYNEGRKDGDKIIVKSKEEGKKKKNEKMEVEKGAEVIDLIDVSSGKGENVQADNFD